jgi:hypothetical protein
MARGGDHTELSQLDADIEGYEHADEVRVRVGQLGHRAGEAETVQEAERKTATTRQG